MNQNAAVLNEIHKQAEVSADHAASLLCKAGDPLLKQELTERHMEFSNFASDAEKRLRSIGYRTADGPSFVRLTAKAGLQVSSMLDSSPSQLATLMIHTANTSIVALTKAMNGHGNSLSRDVSSFALHFIDSSHRTIERMKRFL